MKRFFAQVPTVIEKENPAAADKLRRASPHWMRHTHATHPLAHGEELTTVRDNLRHASIQTTSIYLHVDEVKRAGRLEKRFRASRLAVEGQVLLAPTLDPEPRAACARLPVNSPRQAHSS